MNIPIPAWLSETSLQQLLIAIREAGGEARVVGGAVRDHLLGLPVNDLDIASTLLPDALMALAAERGWKAIPTGIAHGTVTLVLPERVVEVTTLRRDVATDGRHAEVAFTDNFEMDAARRDFTINAMSIDAEGTLHDYFGGQEDITSQHVRFIGDAATRIQEDGLRILRFFRFLATHGKPPADEVALAAIRAHADMIDQLSGERIANEMKKLLSADNPAYALRLMQETGGAPHVFGTAIDYAPIIRLLLLERQSDYEASVWARILALMPGADAATASWLANRWKLSRAEAQQLHLLTSLPAFDITAAKHTHTRLIRLHAAPLYLDWLLLNAARTPGIDVAPYAALAHDFKPSPFPLQARDLLERGMQEGKALGEMLAQLEHYWESEDYRPTRDELLDRFTQMRT